MTLCPIAIAIGCKKCPVFGLCPVKGVIGNYKKENNAKSGSGAHKAKNSGKRRS